MSVPGVTLTERRLSWSRAILADITAHDDGLVRHAAELAVEVETDPERREAARKVLGLVDG